MARFLALLAAVIAAMWAGAAAAQQHVQFSSVGDNGLGQPGTVIDGMVPIAGMDPAARADALARAPAFIARTLGPP